MRRSTLLLLLLLSLRAAAEPAPPPLQVAQAATQPAPAESQGRSLTLDGAVQAARTHHPDVVNANALTGAADSRVDEARAPLFPQATATGRYQHTWRENNSGALVQTGGTGGTGTTTLTNASDLWQASVSVSQLVYDFGQTTGRLHAAQFSADAQKATADTTLRTVILNVRTAYFAARADKALVGVARETLDNQQKHLEQVQAFIQVGTRPEIDLAQSKTDVANARLALIRAENTYATGRAVLNQAMGIPGSTDYDVADESLPQIQGEDGTLEAALDAAYRARPDLRAFVAERKSQDEIISSIKGQYWPVVSLVGTAQESGDALDDLGWNVIGGVTISWPFFQGGLTKASVKEAEYNAVSIDAQTEALRQSVRVELQNALLAVRGAKSEIQAADEALVNARERLRLAEGRYQTGVGSIIELGDAQVALTQAAAQKVQADFDLATARGQLLHALGNDT